MAIDYVMPKLAMAMNEGTINEWLVEEGGYVNKGDVIADIETEKTAYEVESPESGYFHILVSAGTTIDCGEVIGQFAADETELATLQSAEPGQASVETRDSAEDSPATPSQMADLASSTAQSIPFSSPTEPVIRHKPGRVNVSPLARKLAADRKVPLSAIQGTGPGGRIVKRDVLGAESKDSALPMLQATRIRARVPFKGARKTIASRMMESLQNSAQLSSFWESDITRLLDIREQFVAREDVFGTRVSMNAFLAKAIVYAIRQIPIANSSLEGDEIVIYENINLGFAVSLPGQTEFDSSLVVPVLKNVEAMGVVELDVSLKALVARVRAGETTEDDYVGSTITLSTTAGIAPPGHRSTPVLNMPNAVLVGPSTPCEKPAVFDGQVVPRTLMPINVTFDHRILDGDPAVRFMSAIHECLEQPELMLA